MKIKEEMELNELWMEEVWGINDMRASRKDLLSVQKMVIEGWLAVVDIQVKAKFDGCHHFRNSNNWSKFDTF